MKLTIPLAVLLFAAPYASAITVFDVTNMTVNDSGNPGNVALTNGGSTQITTSGDLNLVNFTVGSSTTYLATDFISGIGTNRDITSSNVAGVIQNSTATSDGSLAHGTPSDLSTYLTQGERGLAFSSALNYTTSDDPGTITFDLSFKSDPTAGSRPTFIVGDGADNQSIDLWSFLDSDDNVLFSFTIGPDEYSVFGKQVVDRVSSDDSGFNGGNTSSSNNTARGLGLSAFSLTSADLNGASWEDVAQLSIRVPATGNQPKTDYAFFGVDTGLVDSPDMVVAVPEPSSSALLLLGSIGFILRRKR
ncbi:PEP-CTERM sorting domain-containing protein [Rubritalea spongiae]|uniref:PEP-CTERM sorting domain-containing protein n=1 Tax=Rubritalea spongiae TaxID=430797 RepID=A0ABW5E638_9BACT